MTRAHTRLQLVGVGVLLILALAGVMNGLARPLAARADGVATDSTVVDRLSRPYFEAAQPSSMSAADQAGNTTAILASELLLASGDDYAIDLPMINK